MKKIYLFFALTLIVKFGYTQCTANVSCLAQNDTYGFCPDTITNLPVAYVNHPYNTTISFKVPANGADWTYPLLTVNKVEIYKDGTTGTYDDGFINMPAGIGYQCSGTSGKCEWPGGTNGCLLITGTPTTEGLYKIKVVVKAYAAGGALTLLDTAYGYKINVLPESAGFAKLNNNKFDLAQNVPNPFSSETVISYNTTKASPVAFKVYDLLGKEILTQNFRSRTGINEIKFNAKDYHLKPGVYFYSITTNGETLSRRMIVKD